jgi:beta-N-acetylhexosaminidase
MDATANLKTEDAVRASVDTINHLMDEIGISINFAPIVDIAKNAAIINKRSFGNDPAIIMKQAGVFIDETQKDGKAATIKHFPGHGAVTGDTHKQSVFINGKMTELATFEKVMNQSKPVFVMVGHISVRNNPEGFNTENDRPATTSRKIVTELLREKMGFKGIITTDAMNMQASKNFPDADWEAAKAGVDLVLMPADPAKLNRLIAAEITKGSALGKQFEASVKRMIKLKLLQ